MVGPINPIAMTIMQEVIPPEIRARVFGIASAGFMAGTPLGGLFCGYLITWIGLFPTLLTMAIIYLLATSSLLINPALKAMDSQMA
jgi:MFS family permease